MKTKIFIILIVLFGLGVGGFFVWKNFSAPEVEKEKIEEKLGAEDYLKKEILGISNYPSFKDACLAIYGKDGFSDLEIRHVEALFEIFKTKKNLHAAPTEVLAYLITDVIDLGINASPSALKNFRTSWRYSTGLSYFHDEVIPLAKNITTGASDDLGAIHMIVSWVRQNIFEDDTVAPPGYSDEVKSILEERRTSTTGTCFYYSNLITALCRGAGIPARKVSGDFGKPGHVWVECYVKGKWVAVDSTGFLGDILDINDIAQFGDYLVTVDTFDPINVCGIDVSPSYNRYALELLLEHVKKISIESNVINRIQELLNQFEQEEDLGKRYLYASEIMDTCAKEVAARKAEIPPDQALVVSLWDFDRRIREQNFIDQLKKTEAICVYDITTLRDVGIVADSDHDFPLEKLHNVAQQIKSYRSARAVYFLLVHYDKCSYHSGEKQAFVELLTTEDINALHDVYQDILVESPQLLRNFVNEISSVEIGEKEIVTFNLPKTLPSGVNYEIFTNGISFQGGKYEITFGIRSSYYIRGILIQTRVTQVELFGFRREEAGYNRIRIVDEQGKVYIDPPYDECPSGIYFEGDQVIRIGQENGYITIVGDITKKPN